MSKFNTKIFLQPIWTILLLFLMGTMSLDAQRKVFSKGKHWWNRDNNRFRLKSVKTGTFARGTIILPH